MLSFQQFFVEEIVSNLESQKLFAGYSYNTAWDLSSWHYDHGDKTMPIVKKVEVIKDAYNHIFKPYHIEYDLKSKRTISSNK